MKRIYDVLLSKLRQCIDKYGLIDDGDRVLCAVSGGKDSVAMAYGLKKLSEFYPKKFKVCALTVDMGFDNADFSALSEFFKAGQIPYDIVKTEIGKAIAELENPCSLCARMRRAVLSEYAEKNGFNKLALGHTEDDLAQTALMNLLYGGKLYALEYKTLYDDKNLTLIRPLMMTNEKTVIKAKEELSLPTVKNPCGRDKDSKREEARQIIAQTDKTCRGCAHRIAKAFDE